MITADYLRTVLRYDSDSGLFTWLVCLSRNQPAGHIAGSMHERGYIAIRVDGVQYPAARLAWLYVFGKFPEGVADHIDGLPWNNRLANLRDVSKTVNGQNQKRAHKNNKIGLLGVHQERKGFVAQIKVNGKRVWLGNHSNPSLAHSVYLEAKRKYQEGCTI